MRSWYKDGDLKRIVGFNNGVDEEIGGSGADGLSFKGKGRLHRTMGSAI